MSVGVEALSFFLSLRGGRGGAAFLTSLLHSAGPGESDLILDTMSGITVGIV